AGRPPRSRPARAPSGSAAAAGGHRPPPGARTAPRRLPGRTDLPGFLPGLRGDGKPEGADTTAAPPLHGRGDPGKQSHTAEGAARPSSRGTLPERPAPSDRAREESSIVPAPASPA